MQQSRCQISDAIRARFGRIAVAPETETKQAVGRVRAEHLGYSGRDLDTLPTQAAESFCGVGNPLSLAPIPGGATVMDVGCGAGMDSLLAARLVGSTGRVVGIDMTPEMLVKACRNAAVAGAGNVEFRGGGAEHLPAPDGSFDFVITNGLFNLCPDKPKAFAEAFRVLKPGGLMLMADILLDETVPEEEIAAKGEWSQ